jgi:hypothetical protein
MFRYRDRMRNAALEYALAGWPVIPGATTTPTGRCSCGNRACALPGAHPIPAWETIATTDLDRVSAWWSGSLPTRPIVLPTGGVFDAWLVPRVLGALAERIIERAPAPFPALGRSHRGQWMFLTQPASSPLLPSGVKRLTTGSWLIAPPTRTPLGRNRWVWVPRPGHLPPASHLVAVLADAAERLGTQPGHDPGAAIAVR